MILKSCRPKEARFKLLYNTNLVLMMTLDGCSTVFNHVMCLSQAA